MVKSQKSIQQLRPLVGGSGDFICFPFSWECHHPNWRSHIFQRGRVQPSTRSYFGISTYINHLQIYTNHRLTIIWKHQPDHLVPSPAGAAHDQLSSLVRLSATDAASCGFGKWWCIREVKRENIIFRMFFSFFYSWSWYETMKFVWVDGFWEQLVHRLYSLS